MAAPTSTDVVVRRDKTFVCVEYPGTVVNIDRMLDTLGGIDAVSKVYANPTHRLELKFRPEDTHCKPVYGDRFNTTRVLLKVKKTWPKNEPENASYKSEILGTVDHTYKFRCLMDFQYLSMKRNESGTYDSIIPELIPLKLEPRSWLKEEAPLLLTPIAFSRIDNPVDYHFRAEPKQRNAEATKKQSSDNLISRIRKKRAGYTIFVTYDEAEVPREQKKEMKNLLEQKHCNKEMLRRVKEAFELIPIWSKHSLSAHLRTEKSELKYLLPASAYYFISGPWRGLWVKYGYDPRLDSKAKELQILDFRIRKESVPNVTMGRRPRSNYVLAIKFNASQTKPATIIKDTFEPVASTSSATPNDEELLEQERFVKFRHGVLPPLHQMFYQLSNIEVAEVQALVHSNDGKEKFCTERDGFCAPGILNKCRNIMAEIASKTYADCISKNADKSQEESMVIDGSEASGSGIGAKKSSNADESEESEEEAPMPSDESDSN